MQHACVHVQKWRYFNKLHFKRHHECNSCVLRFDGSLWHHIAILIHNMTSTSCQVPSQVPYAPYRLVVYIPPGNWGWHIIFPPPRFLAPFWEWVALLPFLGGICFLVFIQHIATNGRVHACLQEAYVPPAPQSRPEVWRMRIVDFCSWR